MIRWKSAPCARGGRTARAAMRLNSASRRKKSPRKDETANTFPQQRRSRPRRISRAHDNQARAYRAFSVSQSVLRTVPMWQPLRKAESSRGVTILALDSACFRIAFAGSKTSLKPCPLFKDR